MISINSLSAFALGYFLIFTAIIGLCIGSFSNVLILRGLSGESVVLPPSKCPKCDNKLKWYDNIPLLSYLFLKGKCRFCKEQISLQYPFVEALTAILYILAFLKFDFSVTTLFMFAFISMFIILSATDLKEQVILTPHAYVLAILGLLYNYIVNREFLLPVIGIVIGFLTMEFLARLGQLLLGKRAFGEGDSYIAAAIGAIVGWKLFISSLVVAIIIQTFLILPQFLYKLFKNKNFVLLCSILAFALISIVIALFKYINFVVYIILALSLMALGVIIISQIFKTARNTELQAFPFGPAMLVSAFLFIFFKNYLSAFIF